MSGWSKAWLPEIAIVRDRGTWFPIRQHFDVHAFGVNAWGGDEGQELIGEHDELGPTAQQHEELYVVLSGHARFTVDGEEVDAPAGSCVFLPEPGARRYAVAVEDGTQVLAVGAEPGKPFEVSAWEWSFRARPHLEAGEWERAAAILAEGLREHPGNGSLRHDLARCEARLGRPDLQQ